MKILRMKNFHETMKIQISAKSLMTTISFAIMKILKAAVVQTTVMILAIATGHETMTSLMIAIVLMTVMSQSSTVTPMIVRSLKVIKFLKIVKS